MPPDCINYGGPTQSRGHLQRRATTLLLVHPALGVLANVWQPVPAQPLLRVLVRPVGGVDCRADAHEDNDRLEECREWQEEVGDEDEGEDRRRQKCGLVCCLSARDNGNSGREGASCSTACFARNRLTVEADVVILRLEDQEKQSWR